MTKWKTLFSTLVLTLVLLLNIAPNAHADTGKLTMTADRTNLNHGETVKVTVASNLAFETRVPVSRLLTMPLLWNLFPPLPR